MNLPTIIIGTLVIGIFVAAFVKLILDKKKGKSSCSCGCGGGCLGCSACHPTAQDKPSQNK